ncbi:1-acyl-sn-glycerol-3-phosphate acyltransferase [Polynucleobacter sp. es-GGE-1]|uniref:lysophospholipid acyltransferase family protein n=1 Tax=Polynucleobacter sp. es-GGE-1 TaxID=1819724 RepID=UPI001C0BA5DB|nr:lysophospholipid acyltransferase family protein [Polynucleobacter sp. es-GGE-1]MBU3634077.1 1-acyl-sn-glycerol-3-phosphate acyltransferase [Polynucleobacter sp. es-GGE-1]
MSIPPAFIEKETPFITRFGLWMAIWAHVLSGVATLFMVFPFANLKTRHFHIQQWSIKLLKIFGIQLRVMNPGILPSNSYLLASNHISWLDIHAINAFKPIRFVAKSEVEKWPIFGWMAKQLGTVFIKRDSSRHAHVVVGEMSAVLKSESVCIFPEGTSTIGETVRPFKPNLFEAAVMADLPVYTLAIRYLFKATGQRSDVPAFVGDMGLLESMSKILKNRNLIAELTFFPPPAATSEQPSDRKWLALHSHEQIAKYLSSSNTL